MQISRIEKATPQQLQWLVWAAFFLVSLCSMLPMDGFYQALVFTFVNTGFYALIIYGNIYFLYPRFFLKSQKTTYVLLVLIFLGLCAVTRSFSTFYLYNTFFSKKPQPFPAYTIVYYFLTGILIFLLSFIFRVAIAYFSLKKKTDEIIAEKTAAELNLLKSQVQPHFLFNTLNNIYYEAYLESPRAAGLIERLSAIMRYFVDESPKPEVLIKTEVNFLENYIELEKIRLRHQIHLVFVKDYPVDAMIPPMLLMALVENIFKHGIDKTSASNHIQITLLCQGDSLSFTTQNAITPGKAPGNGFGLQNLRKRLELIYGDDFEFEINQSDKSFQSAFKIPLK